MQFCRLLPKTPHFHRGTVHSTSQVHGSSHGMVRFEEQTRVWAGARAGRLVLGLLKRRRRLWSHYSSQGTGARKFTYWLVSGYGDGGNSRAIGLAANRATHLNTRAQRGSGREAHLQSPKLYSLMHSTMSGLLSWPTQLLNLFHVVIFNYVSCNCPTGRDVWLCFCGLQQEQQSPLTLDDGQSSILQ